MTALPNARTSSQPSAMDYVVSWIDALVNRFLALTQNAAQLRSTLWTLFKFGFIALAILAYTPLSAWIDQLGPLLQAVLGTDAAPQVRSALTLGFVWFAVQAVLNPEVLRLLICLFLPLWLARHFAASYLADIFEKDFEVADKFVGQAAFGVDYNSVRVSHGRVVEPDQDSPIVQIGGPGYIRVDLDSAVVTEKADGTPRVIAPTGGHPHHREVLDGFERIRQGVDLRDRDDAASFTYRSRDGIPVEVRDAHWRSSVHRGHRAPSDTMPYPFNEAAVRTLIYEAGRPVPGSSARRLPGWQTALPGSAGGIVGATFAGFISQHGLGEFLASIGEPELEELRHLQQEISQDEPRAPESGVPVGAAGAESAAAAAEDLNARFVSREFVSALFQGDSFHENSARRGVQLPWVGVGTWNLQARIPDEHVEAWKLSRDNIARSNPEILDRRRHDARLQELQRIVQESVLGVFYKYVGKKQPREIVRALLMDYDERLRRGQRLFEEGGMDVPLDLVNAIQALADLKDRSQWGIHWMEGEDESVS